MANVFQSLNDSAVGVVIGTTFHTLGAIGLLGGLVGYLAWHRHLQRGHHHPKVLAFATFLTYLSIVVNLLGGFMRTYETGHPSITEFGTSAWVRAIAIKHLFLFAGMGAAVYLFERIAPRHLRAMKGNALGQESFTGHAVGVLAVALSIVIAAVLGAVSTVLPVAAAADGMDDHDAHALQPDVFHNATGQFVSTPLQPGQAGGDFQVPAGTTDLDVTFVWTPAQANLVIELESGQQSFQPAGTGGASEGRLGSPPRPGSWSYRITSPDPVANAQYTLSIRMPQAAGNQSFLTNTITLPPGVEGGVSFYEINTVSPLNGTLYWDWSASASVHFDVHSHFDGDVQYPVTMTAQEHAGAYTNDREGGYSYLWENTGPLPVTVTYRVWGDWELDSIFP